LTDHFNRHGPDFDAKSAEDYARRANQFFERRAQFPTKVDSDGVIRVYDPRTNTFGAYNPNGTTRTFLKPKLPGYFDKQPGTLKE
jgi:pyocin large subunit-like protein